MFFSSLSPRIPLLSFRPIMLLLFFFSCCGICSVGSAFSSAYKLRGANIPPLPQALYSGNNVLVARLSRITCVGPRGTAVAFTREHVILHDESVKNADQDDISVPSFLNLQIFLSL